MLAAHEERFQRIYSDFVERPGGDYGELLQRGEVGSPEGVDPEAWREEIRRKARNDKLRVSTSRHGSRAFAVLKRPIPYDPDEVMRRYLLPVAELWDLAESKPRARARPDRLDAPRPGVHLVVRGLRSAHLHAARHAADQ